MLNSVENTLGNIGAMLENVETCVNVTCLNFVEQRCCNIVQMWVYWMPHSTSTIPTRHSGCRMWVCVAELCLKPGAVSTMFVYLSYNHKCQLELLDSWRLTSYCFNIYEPRITLIMSYACIITYISKHAYLYCPYVHSCMHACTLIIHVFTFMCAYIYMDICV